MLKTILLALRKRALHHAIAAWEEAMRLPYSHANQAHVFACYHAVNHAEKMLAALDIHAALSIRWGNA